MRWRIAGGDIIKSERDAALAELERIAQQLRADAAWRWAKMGFLLRHPLCHVGCGRLATEVHRFRSARDYPELHLNQANLYGTCKAHRLVKSKPDHG